MITITLTGEDALAYINKRDKGKVKVPVPAETPVDIDKDWREFVEDVRSGELSIDTSISKGKLWEERELGVMHNAVGKSDRMYYSVKALSMFLGRSVNAIRSKAITGLGYAIHEGLLVVDNDKSKI